MFFKNNMIFQNIFLFGSNNATLKCNEIRAHHSIEHVYNCRGTEVDNKRPSDSEGESPYNQLNRSEMIRLISLQHFDGSWSPSRELEKILKLTKDELVMKNQVCNYLVGK